MKKRVTVTAIWDNSSVICTADENAAFLNAIKYPLIQDATDMKGSPQASILRHVAVSGVFISPSIGGMYYYYGSTTVPAGWLAALAYIRDGAHVKLIVPHKMGHDRALSNVYPYFYDLRKIQFWR